MPFTAVDAKTPTNPQIRPYAKVDEYDGSIEYGYYDAEGDDWIVARLSADGVLRINEYHIEESCGLDRLIVEGYTRNDVDVALVAPALKETLANGQEIEVRSFYSEPEVYVDGDLVGWFRKFDGGELEFINKAACRSVSLESISDEPSDFKTTLDNGSVLEIRHDEGLPGEPELFLDGEYVGFFEADPTGVDFCNSYGANKLLSVSGRGADDQFGLDEPDPLDLGPFKQGEAASIEFALVSGDILKVSRKEHETNPVIFVNDVRLGFVNFDNPRTFDERDSFFYPGAI